MSGVQDESDVLRVGVRHNVLNFVLVLELAAQMSVGAESHPFFHIDSAAEDLQRFGDVLEVLFSGTLGPPVSEVGF